MKTRLFTAVSVLSLIASGSASAHDAGWYLRGNGGYGVHTEDGFTGDVISNAHGNGVQSEGGVTASLGAGYDFGDHWRLELDADTLYSDLGSIGGIPQSFAKLRTDTAMINALYDFGDFGGFEPYVGAGLGIVRGKASLVAQDFVTVDGRGATNPACLGPRTVNQAEACSIIDNDSGLGWQLLAGLGYKVSDNLTWDTHYSYLNGPDLELDGLRTNQATGGTADIASTFQDVGAHALVTGLRYTFGHRHAAAPAKVMAPAPVPVPPPVQTYTPPPAPLAVSSECWDGSYVTGAEKCPPPPEPVVFEPAPAPMVACNDGSFVSDAAFCPVQQAVVTQPIIVEPVVQQSNLNLCSDSAVAIFNAPAGANYKQLSRLGTMPQFGDSHGLSPQQFYEKLDARARASASDRSYLNYLFRSMGYANGWSDAQPYMFSDDVLPVGTRGVMGVGEAHHYGYYILPTNDRDRQAFRVQSANGSVVHFMKSCGNYMYGCE